MDLKTLSRRLVSLGICAGLLALAPAASAKQYYMKKDVKFHLGDNSFARSEDALFIDTYPVVGQQWVARFSVDRVDKVKVKIEHIWGVDDCPYCKIIISIDDQDMGRLYQEDNRKSFDTPSALAKPVMPGKMYTLKIASIGDAQVDDFVIENVIVETDQAEVKFAVNDPTIGPIDMPLPPVPAPRPQAAPCASLNGEVAWLYGYLLKDPVPAEVEAKADEFVTTQPLCRLQKGDSFACDLKVLKVDEKGDIISRPLEILVGEDKKSGWVLSFMPGSDRVIHGNLMKIGEYASDSFDSAYKPGDWNRLQVSHCRNGIAHLSLNGGDVGSGVPVESGELFLRVRTIGIQAQVKPVK